MLTSALRTDGNMKSSDFMIATCHPPTLKPWSCSASTGNCVVDNSTSPVVDNKTTFKTQQECAAKCIAPPPPPLSKNPCIRFGHTIPVANHVDVTISQEGPPAISHTWCAPFRGHTALSARQLRLVD